MKRILTILTVLVLTVMLCVAISAKEVTVLFTHDLHSHLLPSRDESGGDFAISSYLKEMSGEMDAAYSKTDGRKVVYSSLNPIKLLSNANIFTYALLIVLALVIVAIIFIVRAIVRKVKKRKRIKPFSFFLLSVLPI